MTGHRHAKNYLHTMVFRLWISYISKFRVNINALNLYALNKWLELNFNWFKFSCLWDLCKEKFKRLIILEAWYLHLIGPRSLINVRLKPEEPASSAFSKNFMKFSTKQTTKGSMGPQTSKEGHRTLNTPTPSPQHSAHSAHTPFGHSLRRVRDPGGGIYAGLKGEYSKEGARVETANRRKVYIVGRG